MSDYPSREWEDWAFERGYQIVAGVDEVGRGPLAGPVVACACIVPKNICIDGINDSKKLKADQRQRINQALKGDPEVIYGIGVIEVEEIDRINILQASFAAMRQAIEKLSVEPDFLLVDGHLIIPKMKVAQRPLIQGDSLSISIAAASILAKCFRDELMMSYHQLYPGYGFDEHKGYATEKHREALYKIGPSPLHRKSFEPIKTLIQECKWQKA